jgi:glycolate oxidase FAD binding subunit
MTDINAKNLDEVGAAIRTAMADKTSLDVIGTGSKRHLGCETNADAALNTSAMSGIIDYQPEELVMTVRAATPMREIESVLNAANQMLPFEPPDMGHILGQHSTGSGGSIGGIIATNLSGPRRLTAGAARDYLLGFEAISGRGERFKSGGKVMKNVTGYDLSKLMCGSFGTLAVMDEITLKTLPASETNISLLLHADSFSAAVKLIAEVFATPHEPGSAAILPQASAAEANLCSAKAGAGSAFTAVIRLEGIAPSVDDRLANLKALFGGEMLAKPSSDTLWRQIRDVQPLAELPQDIWKLSVAPADAPKIIAAMDSISDVSYFADWAGGLLWLSSPKSEQLGLTLRQALSGLHGGFAMLVRDVGATRRQIAPFQPLPPGMFDLHKRVKAAFDPLGVLNFGRMHASI